MASLEEANADLQVQQRMMPARYYDPNNYCPRNGLLDRTSSTTGIICYVWPFAFKSKNRGTIGGLETILSFPLIIV